MRNGILLIILAAATWVAEAPAQPPDGEGRRGGFGRDRGEDGGDRGGFRGERGGRGGFGEGRDGPGGRGGFGGGRGGFGGGRGRGGFDPSSFLDRLDRNSNGMLDPDEMEGPASMMIQRLQRVDPSIRTDRPIPMSKLKEGFEQMRGGGGRNGGDGDSDDDDAEESLAVDVLVPGFGGLEMPPPVPGFSAAAELLAVRVTDADTREAEENMRRYDRNRDGFISQDELSRRWDGNPMDFDQNGDDKLSPNELAVRAARRRIDRTQQEARRNNRNERRRESQEDELEEVADRFDGRLSYRPQREAMREGLPGWFGEKDRNGDGQVSMNEFEQSWTDEKVEEFYGFDLNRDGTLTDDEVLRAVKQGGSRSRSSASASATSSSASEASSSTSRSEPVAPIAEGDLEPKNVKIAERIISRNDKDGNDVLTVDEWKEMFMDVSPADADRDGRITVPEYAGWMQARATKLGGD